MPHIQLIPQQREDYCVCSILQGILARYRLNFSQEELAKNLKPTDNGHRVDEDKIKNFLNANGFAYSFFWHNETPFNEPDTLLEEINKNNGFIAIGTHAYRVLSFTYPEIVVDDPKDASRKTFNLHDLMKQLSKSGGGFGLIKKIV